MRMRGPPSKGHGTYGDSIKMRIAFRRLWCQLPDTRVAGHSHSRESGNPLRQPPVTVIPAKAGIHSASLQSRSFPRKRESTPPASRNAMSTEWITLSAQRAAEPLSRAAAENLVGYALRGILPGKCLGPLQAPRY